MMSSDSQAMGRIGEVIIRTWQTADKMKRAARRRSPGETAGQRQPAGPGATWPSTRSTRRSPTASPTRSGRSRRGKLADLVLWKPAFFGVKPELVVKGGFIAWAAMGDPNASIPTPQPVLYRPMFGAFGRAGASTSLTFVSRRRSTPACRRASGSRDGRSAVQRCRGLDQDATWSTTTRCPRSRSIPRPTRCAPTASCSTCEPARVLPLAQRYFLF